MLYAGFLTQDLDSRANNKGALEKRIHNPCPCLSWESHHSCAKGRAEGDAQNEDLLATSLVISMHQVTDLGNTLIRQMPTYKAKNVLKEEI